MTRQESRCLKTGSAFSLRTVTRCRSLWWQRLIVCLAVALASVACCERGIAQAAGSQQVDLCADAVLNPKPPVLTCPRPAPDKKIPTNDVQGTKAALACEWRDIDNLKHALKALTYLSCATTDAAMAKQTCSSEEIRKQRPLTILTKVRDELGQGVNGRQYETCLYQWALMGADWTDSQKEKCAKADHKGASPFMPDFAKALETANTLTIADAGVNKKSAFDQEIYKQTLFKCTEKLVDDMYASALGWEALGRSQQRFSENLPALALIELINGELSIARNDATAANVEKFRAAFEADWSQVAKQVAAKINGSTD